jgi:hypothetical protein
VLEPLRAEHEAALGGEQLAAALESVRLRPRFAHPMLRDGGQACLVTPAKAGVQGGAADRRARRLSPG